MRLVLHTVVYVKSAETKKATIWLPIRFFKDGAGEGTRTLTPKAQEPKSCASTNFATPAEWDQHNLIGVADGARTHDNRNHNPGLYQLSYSHQRDYINQC